MELSLLKLKKECINHQEFPLSDKKTNMKDIILKMSKKGFGCVGITNEKKKLIGIITDGDLRRNMTKGILEKMQRK